MSVKSNDRLQQLSQRVISCTRCPRLTEYRERIAREKVKRYRDLEYWGKPLPGFGDAKAELLIVGLAPAAHGGNRTGRMFTGDKSGEWVYKALYDTGFSDRPASESREDSLILTKAYITAVVRCAPPKNRPLPEEIRSCAEYLKEELNILTGIKVVLTLGRIAFDNYLRSMLTLHPNLRSLKIEFRHGATYKINNNLTLIASYHPSRQNTQTGRLTWTMWIDVFKEAKRILETKE